MMSIKERSLYDKGFYFGGRNLLALQRSVHSGRSLLKSIDVVSFTYGILSKTLNDGGFTLVNFTLIASSLNFPAKTFIVNSVTILLFNKFASLQTVPETGSIYGNPLTQDKLWLDRILLTFSE